MKRLISLLTLLLLWPAFASAACPPECLITSGSYTAQSGAFNFAGNGFSGSGKFIFADGPSPLSSPVAPGGFLSLNWADNSSDTLVIDSLEIGNTPLLVEGGITGDAGIAVASIGGSVLIAGPGASHFGSGSIDVSYNYGTLCLTTCQSIEFFGGGTAMAYAVPDPYVPGLDITSATITFRVPEPSTTSLLLIAFAGLALLGRRCRSRATLLPAS